jgi:hypothetical protein
VNLTVSPQIKIVALIGILAAVGVFLGMQVLGHSSSTSSAPKVIAPLHPVKVHIKTLRPTTKVTVVARPAAAHKTVAHAKVTTTKPKVVAVAAAPTPSNGLPARINEALLAFPVVVVALYNPQSPIDSTSLDEAAAGAKLAKVGFVAVNVLDQSQAAPLAELLGVIQDPTLLVYARPGTLTFRVNGFADRQVVAQAALNAKRV